MSDNIYAKSDRLFKLSKRFIYPSLVYPALLAVWGLVAATNYWLTGHGISFGMTENQVWMGFIPMTAPWLITGIVLSGFAADEQERATNRVRRSDQGWN